MASFCRTLFQEQESRRLYLQTFRYTLQDATNRQEGGYSLGITSLGRFLQSPSPPSATLLTVAAPPLTVTDFASLGLSCLASDLHRSLLSQYKEHLGVDSKRIPTNNSATKFAEVLAKAWKEYNNESFCAALLSKAPMAVDTILCASYWSARSAREAAIEQDKLSKVMPSCFKRLFHFDLMG